MSQNVQKCPNVTDAQLEQTVDSERPDGFSERQRVALDMIVSGATDPVVAEAVGVNRRTVFRWRVENDRFREELDRRRRELYDRAQDRFRSMLNRALDLLDKQISDKYAPTALRAARTLLYIARIGKTAVPEGQQINASEK